MPRTWKKITNDADKLKERHRLLKFFTSKRDSKKLNELVRRLSESVEQFQVRAIWPLAQYVTMFLT